MPQRTWMRATRIAPAVNAAAPLLLHRRSLTKHGDVPVRSSEQDRATRGKSTHAVLRTAPPRTPTPDPRTVA